MEYISVKEASEKWGVSTRAITYHVVAGTLMGLRGFTRCVPGAKEKGIIYGVGVSRRYH